MARRTQNISWWSGVIIATVFVLILASPRIFGAFFIAPSDITSLALAVLSDFFLILSLIIFEKRAPRIGVSLRFLFLVLLSTDWLVWLYARRHLSELPDAVNGPYELFYVLKMPEYQIALFFSFLLAMFMMFFLWRPVGNFASREGTGLVQAAAKPRHQLIAILLSLFLAIGVKEISSHLAVGNSRAVTIIEALNILPSGIGQFDIAGLASSANDDDQTTSAIVLSEKELNALEDLGLPARRGTLMHLISPRKRGQNNSQVQLSQMPPKIILVTIESLARSLIHQFNKPHKTFSVPDWATPNLDRLAKTAVSFNHHGTTMMPTMVGLKATLLSLPFELEEGKYRQKSLPKVLNQAGYKTIYMQSDHLLFSRMDRVAKNIFEYERIYGRNEIQQLMNGDADEWGWGVRDSALYDSALKVMSQNSDEKQFLHIMTLDTHPPWPYVKSLPDSPPELLNADRMVQALYSADRALGHFLESLERDGWLDRGALIVITADHSPNHFYSEYMPENPSLAPDLIPLFILHKELNQSAISKDITNRMSSQVDVAPTILSLLDLDIPDQFFGRNLFDPDTKPLWLRRIDSNLHEQIVEVRGSSGAVNARFSHSPKMKTQVENPGGYSMEATINRWFRKKTQSELLPTGFSQIMVNAAEASSAEDDKANQPNNYSLIFSSKDGIRLYSRRGKDYGFVVNRLWDGSEITNPVATKTGVAMRAFRPLIVNVDAGTREIGGICGITAIPETKIKFPTGFECRFSLNGKTLKSILFRPGNSGFEKFVLNFPAGVTSVLFDLLPTDSEAPGANYGQGFLGDLHIH